jgi:hypothetical protein
MDANAHNHPVNARKECNLLFLHTFQHWDLPETLILLGFSRGTPLADSFSGRPWPGNEGEVP